MSRLSFALLLSGLLSLAVAAPAAAPSKAPSESPLPLRMGGFVVAPLMLSGPSGEMRGALPDFINAELAPQAQRLRFVWVPPMSFPRAIRSLRDGHIDVLMMYGAEAAVLQGFRRFDWVYLQTQAQLAVRPSSALLAVELLEQLAGLEIGWISNSQLPPELDGLSIKWQLTTGQNWQRINLRKLNAGRIDAAYFANPYSPSYLAQQEGIAIRLLPLPLPARTFTMAYSLSADPAAIAEFDRLAQRAFKGERFRRFVENYRD
jgi:polar amino acid transport system substrate-binding protein